MASIDNNNTSSETPENDPSNAMNSKQEVAQSPDEKIDEDFPGYPHYPSKEDIMHQSTGAHRVDADLENMGAGPNATGVSQRYLAGQDSDRSQTNALHRQEGEEGRLDSTNEEIGLPHNVTNDDMDSQADRPGTDIDEAAEKGSLNP